MKCDGHKVRLCNVEVRVNKPNERERYRRRLQISCGRLSSANVRLRKEPSDPDLKLEHQPRSVYTHTYLHRTRKCKVESSQSDWRESHMQRYGYRSGSLGDHHIDVLGSSLKLDVVESPSRITTIGSGL